MLLGTQGIPVTLPSTVEVRAAGPGGRGLSRADGDASDHGGAVAGERIGLADEG